MVISALESVDTTKSPGKYNSLAGTAFTTQNAETPQEPHLVTEEKLSPKLRTKDSRSEHSPHPPRKEKKI